MSTGLEPFPLPDPPARPAPRLRKRVYIAGPITKGDLAHNLNQATAAFVELARAGLAPLCPHWSAYSKPAGWFPHPRAPGAKVLCEATAAGNDRMAYADWLGVDLPWVAVADALLRLPGESYGADAEVACARASGVPVFFSVNDVIVWAGN